METLIDLDKSLFVFLNALGIELFDAFWMFVTNKKSSIPLYLFLIYYIYKKLSHAEFLKYIVLISILIVFTDQLSNLFKDYFERFRPCHDETINDQIRIVKSSC